MHVNFVRYTLKKTLAQYESEELVVEIGNSVEDQKSGAELMREAKKICFDHMTKATTNGDGFKKVEAPKAQNTGVKAPVVVPQKAPQRTESHQGKAIFGRPCPSCGQDAIIKGKAEFGGGLVCFKKKGGCGAKWKDESPFPKEVPEVNFDNDPLPDFDDSDIPF